MNTKEKIIQSAIEQFKEKGFDMVSVPMICEKAQITKGTFYYYFRNKDEVMYEYVEQFLTEYSDVMSEILKTVSPREQLWKLYKYSFEKIVDLSPALLYAYYQADMKNGLLQLSPTKGNTFGYYTNTYTRLLKSLIEKGQMCNEIKNDHSADDLMSAYSAIICGIGLDWSCHKGCYDEIDYLKKMFEIVF